MPQAINDKIKLKKLSENGCVLTFSVSAPAESVNDAFQTALVQVQSEAQIAGFRQGKAPLDLVRKNFASSIRERALDLVLNGALQALMEKEYIWPAAHPKVTKLEFAENKPLGFEAVVETHPKFEAKNYVRAPAVKKKPSADEAKLDAEIKHLLERNARLEAEPPETAAGPEHFVVADVSAFNDGKPAPEHDMKGELIDLSAPHAASGLVEALKGTRQGETREFSPDASNPKLVFKAQVCEVKKKTLPVLDENFAKSMGYENPDALRSAIKTLLLEQSEAESRRDLLRQIEEHVLKENVFSLPPTYVEERLNNAAEGFASRYLAPGSGEKEREKLLSALRPAVERDIRLGYIFGAVAKQENISAGAPEYEAELEHSLSRAATDEERSRIRRHFDENRKEILLALTERKVVEFLEKNASIKEA